MSGRINSATTSTTESTTKPTSRPSLQLDAEIQSLQHQMNDLVTERDRLEMVTSVLDPVVVCYIQLYQPRLPLTTLSISTSSQHIEQESVDRVLLLEEECMR